ncbi:spore germination protein [Paenibacillus radicis (ex Gao et al. 2016)]|uniref:Membrane protein YfkQ n=1 Tax=Paenibacillus radicis (ex Gao et al. 2016) TaxID=1737354 RepID=A0A917HA29_9BACL|nr:spore germination protein [Paenibacillus radicis (ex Gao et al. 2016)]GGG71597.1 putative membrane protein YfkQ [Paenibacillus radicis (ex Gao et al. 2016)]
MNDNKGLESILQMQRELLARPISTSLRSNTDVLRQLFENASDVVFHEFTIRNGPLALLVYIDGITDTKELERHVLAPLKTDGTDGELGWEAVIQRISVSSSQSVRTIQKAADELGAGNPLLLLEGQAVGAFFAIPFWQMRAIEEPQAETVVRGPREGFIETLHVNLSMIRRRLQTPAFKLKKLSIGRYTKTTCAIAYIEGVTDPNLVEEMERRLKDIDVDGIVDSNHIEEWIEDNPLSLFPQLQATERPDVVVSSLLEGRIALLVNGSPFSLIAPVTLLTLMQSSEDYYERSFVATGIRWLRLLISFIAILMPSIYVAVLSFHQEMIPTALLLTISKSREQIPFPALFEALLMEVTFEALREAGIRLPKQVGSAVSIVGALVIGQAAISAGIVSSPMIMVVAITGVASFLIPNYQLGLAIRLIRFPIMFCAGLLGLYGIVLAGVFIVVHMLSLRSFGVPYLSPLSPIQFEQFKDTLVRAPSWALNKRPHLTGSIWNKLRVRPHHSRLKKG